MPGSHAAAAPARAAGGGAASAGPAAKAKLKIGRIPSFLANASTTPGSFASDRDA